jgi:hypothetical protein
MKTKRKSIIASLLLLSILIVACQKEETTPNYGNLKNQINPTGTILCWNNSNLPQNTYGSFSFSMMNQQALTIRYEAYNMVQPLIISKIKFWIGKDSTSYPKKSGKVNLDKFPIQVNNINKSLYIKDLSGNWDGQYFYIAYAEIKVGCSTKCVYAYGKVIPGGVISKVVISPL